MRLLFIICESGVEARIIEMLVRLEVTGYTRFTGASGSGKRGRREGSPVWPGLNSLLMVSVPAESVAQVVEQLDRLEAERGGRLAVKVFSVPSEEYC